ncbi:YbjP/YqhG family protein [Kosakonia oryzendophytica]|nr:YbjP/YqhG family protein [Kosakonia oryzendophytica]WBT57187.1 YbjP/YqhG family protein [Kosakonia oryzendophytica]
MMRYVLSLLLALYLPFASANTGTDVQKEITAFYTYYLNEFGKTPPDELIKTKTMQQWASKKLLARMAVIYDMPEQELLGSDYFTYCQDYDPAWIARLNVSPAKPDGDSMKLDVSLGIENNKAKHLQVWTRKEEGKWKIWRVVDAGNHYEQKLY